MLQWLHVQQPPCPWDEMACEWAARRGHLDVLKWLRGQQPPCLWDIGDCSRSAAHAAIREWIVQNG